MLFGISILSSAVQLLNTYLSIVVIAFDIFISSNFLQFENALSLIFPLFSDSTLLVISSFTMPLLSKAEIPIIVTLLGKVTSSDPGQVLNMLSGTFSVPSSNVTFFKFVHPLNGP